MNKGAKNIAEKKRSSLTRIQEAQNGNFHLCARFQTQIQESQKMLGRDWSGGLIHKAVMKKM